MWYKNTPKAKIIWHLSKTYTMLWCWGMGGGGGGGGGSINSTNDEATFWKRAETLPVEHFHLKIIKSSLFVHSKASNAASRGETGRYPILIHIVKLMLNYWKHMENSKHDNPLLYEAMRSELENCSHKGSWFYTVNAVIKLFCGTNPCNAFDARQINKVIHNMKSSYDKYWRSQLGDPYDPSGKLSLYRKIKPSFRMEQGKLRDLKAATGL